MRKTIATIMHSVRIQHLGLFVAVAACLLLLPSAAHAGLGDDFILLIGKGVEWLNQMMGKILIVAIDILGKVASYNSFGESEAVNIGWVVIRDVSNMLFIVSLIIMSFATILGWQAYRYSRLLGNLVIATVLVNFSKSIALFLVDFSQVIMMTFVNAFRPVLTGNLVTGFGLRTFLAFAESSTSVDINLTEVVSVYALSFIFIIIALVVTVALIVILVNRIIRLWVLIILAPFAFVSNVMPGGLGGFYSDWWKKLGNELFIGPALAFFLWLSMSIIFITSSSGSLGSPDIIKIDPLTNQSTISAGAAPSQVQAVVSEVGSTRNMFNFIATIVLLMHSMTIAKTAATFGGAAAGKLAGFINQGARAVAGGTLKGATRAPGALFKGTGAQGVAQRVGFPLAAAALTPFKKIPLIGGKFRKAQARIREKQDEVKAENMNYLKTMSNKELANIGNRFKLTQGGVNESRYAIRELLRRGKEEYITDQGMARYKSAIGYYSTTDYKKDDKGNFILKDGKKVPHGVTENARDREGFELLKKGMFRYPLLYKTIYPNAKPGTEEYEALRAEYIDDLSKMNKSDLLQIKRDTFENAGDDLTWEKAYADEIAKRVNKSPKFHDDYARDAQDYLYEKFAKYYNYDLANKKAKPVNPLRDVPSGRRKRFDQEQELRKRLGVGEGGVNPLYEGVQNVIAGNRQNVSANVLRTIDNQTLAGKRPEQYLKELQDFSRRVNAGEVMSDAEFAEEKKVFDQLARDQAKKEQEVVEFVAGKDSVARIQAEIKRAQESGRGSVSRFAADFQKLGLDANAAGLNLTGADKEAMVPQLREMFEKQLRDSGASEEVIAAQTQAFSEAIQKTNSLALANTRRKGYSLGHVMRHEGAHPEVEKLSDADREAIFNTLSKEQQEATIADISKRWDLNKLPDVEKRKRAIEEYFTEGLANFGRKDAVGSELDSSMVLAMKAKGVNVRSRILENQQLLNQRDAIAQQVRQQETAVHAATKKINEQVAAFKSAHANAPSFSVQDLQDKLVAKDLEESGASTQELVDLHAAADALRAEEKRLAEFRQQMKGIIDTE